MSITDTTSGAATAESTPRAAARITGRALLVGAITVAVLSLTTAYLGAVARAWDPGGSALPATAVVVLFLLVLLNSLLARLFPRRALTRTELLVTYAMVILMAQFLYKGGMPFITGATTFPFYMATPANDWEHRLLPHLPAWLQLSDPQAVIWYWEGLPPGARLPWAAWTGPIVAWTTFTLAFMTAMFCLASLLCRDWVERQRLAFPLVEIPLAITGDGETPTLRQSILRSPLAWIGFSLPALIEVLGWLHSIRPAVPEVPMDFDVGRAFSGYGLPWNVLSGDNGVHITLLPQLIGIAYLLPSEVSLSLWLFYVLFRVQQLVWASFGYAPGGSASGINPQSFIGMQEAGGFVALSVIVLYQSRHAFASAWRGLRHWRRDARDEEAPLAGRWALLGFLFANLYLLWWAWHVGMPPWSFALAMGLAYTILLGVTRLVAAAGTTHVDPGTYPRQIIMSTLGANAVGPASLAVYAYLATIYMNDPRITLMAQSMNGFKLLHTGRVQRRRFPSAALLAVVIMLALGLPAMLWISYHYGAASLPDWPMMAPARDVFSELDSSLRSPEGPNNWLRVAFLIGAAVMSGLTALHGRFLWWPVSPVGFLIGSGWSTNVFVWSNALIGWALGTLIRRYGGLRLYRTLRPAFLGLILGGYIPGGILSLFSTFFGVKPLG